VTPKQAREARSALRNLMALMAYECDRELKPRYRFDEDGVFIAPTQWETLSLFRLDHELVLRGMDDKP
jgi:hypothetical protein